MAKEDAKASAEPLPGTTAKGKKKGKGLLIGIVVGILALAGAGGAAYWKFGPSAQAAAEAGAEGGAAKAPEAEPGMVAFEPFLVNLADEGGQAYLRVTLSLLVASEEQAKELETRLVVRTRFRSSILEVLSTRTSDQLVTPEGKSDLKKAIAERVASLKEPVDVHDVLFTDFVVQR
jgi:flagellar FliL protein